MAGLGRYTRFITNIYAHTGAPYLSKKRSYAVKPWLKGDVLDIGCGGESSLADLLDEGQRYVCIDIQEDAIQRLRETKPEHEFYCFDIEEEGKLLEIMRSQFDTIVLLAVIEHLKNPAALLRQCRSLLKPNGCIVISTPTPRGDKLMRAFKRAFGIKHEELEEYSPHITNFDEQTLGSLLTSDNHLRVACYKKFEFGLNQLIVGSK